MEVIFTPLDCFGTYILLSGFYCVLTKCNICFHEKVTTRSKKLFAELIHRYNNSSPVTAKWYKVQIPLLTSLKKTKQTLLFPPGVPFEHVNQSSTYFTSSCEVLKPAQQQQLLKHWPWLIIWKNIPSLNAHYFRNICYKLLRQCAFQVGLWSIFDL